MDRLESEDCIPVFAALHLFYNPLPAKARSARLKNNRVETPPFPLVIPSATSPRLHFRLSATSIPLSKTADSTLLCPSIPGGEESSTPLPSVRCERQSVKSAS